MFDIAVKSNSKLRSLKQHQTLHECFIVIDKNFIIYTQEFHYIHPVWTQITLVSILWCICSTVPAVLGRRAQEELSFSADDCRSHLLLMTPDE